MNILENLGDGFEHMANLADRTPLGLHDRQQLQRRHEPVASRRIIGQDHMAGLFTANIVAMLTHVLEHVAVANLGARHLESDIGEKAFEAEIGHDRRHNAWLAEAPVFLPALRDNAHKLVSVDHLPALVDDQDAVGVPVERNADVGAHFPHFVNKLAR